MGIHLSTIPENASQALIELDKDIHIAKLTSISALSISAYDWFVCFDEEVDLVWRASNSVFKYLALFSRYMALIFPIGIVVLRLGNWTEEECEKMKLEAAITSTLVILSCDYLLALRTAAIYSFQRNVSTLLVIVVAVQTALAIWATTNWVRIDLPEGIPGCFVRPGMGHILGVSLYWIPSSVTDLILFVLTVSKVFPIWSSSKESKLSWVLLRDEIMYYGLVTSLTVATNILMYSSNRALGTIMVPLTLTLSPVLVFHLALNLRSVDRYPHRTAEEEPIPMEELLGTIREPPVHPPQTAPLTPPCSGAIDHEDGFDQVQLRARGVGSRIGENRNAVSEDESRFRAVKRRGESDVLWTRNTV
ncbi:hypothetical protein JCM3765_001373 [Sporobolomyces pararoseus]